MSKQPKEEKLIDLIGDFENAMLVTKAEDGRLDARPMAVADHDDDGTIWFVTDRSSGKVAELTLSRDVAVTMQSSNKFVTLTATAKIVDDAAKIEELWRESWKVWFPRGKKDASLTLIKIDPSEGEYWDNSGVAGVKYLIKTGKAYVQGKRAHTDATINATVSME